MVVSRAAMAVVITAAVKVVAKVADMAADNPVLQMIWTTTFRFNPLRAGSVE